MVYSKSADGFTNIALLNNIHLHEYSCVSSDAISECATHDVLKKNKLVFKVDEAKRIW